jgi:hypothetical protein
MQDAILITRRFGVMYMWIDALCIIQHSEDDWLAEARIWRGYTKIRH